MHSHPNDTELIRALQLKERQAGFAVFNMYVKQLTYFVERLTSNTQVAQDIATESFIKTFERAADFQTLGKLKSFLFTVANNAALNWLRHEKVSHAGLKDYQFRVMEQQAEEHYFESEVIQAVHEIIEQLPPQVRQVVKLSLIEGKKLDDIAAEMNISYKTVQHHKAKGFNILRQKLTLKGLYLAAFFITINTGSWPRWK